MLEWQVGFLLDLIASLFPDEEGVFSAEMVFTHMGDRACLPMVTERLFEIEYQTANFIGAVSWDVRRDAYYDVIIKKFKVNDDLG